MFQMALQNSTGRGTERIDAKERLCSEENCLKFTSISEGGKLYRISIDNKYLVKNRKLFSYINLQQ